jgi:hypothetical protein
MSESSHESAGAAAVQAQAATAVVAVVEGPPPAAMPAREAAPPDPRMRLQQLARQLSVASSRRVLIEFLQLRRALR